MTMIDGSVEEDNEYNQADKKKRVIRLIFILLLVAAVLIEGYYIIVLRDNITKRKKEAKDISIQMQFLKNERDKLAEELASIEKLAGENRDGDTSHR